MAEVKDPAMEIETKDPVAEVKDPAMEIETKDPVAEVKDPAMVDRNERSGGRSERSSYGR